MSIERVEKALREIRAGQMVILVDDEDRENEGDLCMAAETVTPEAINFMAKEGRGLICLTLTESRVRQLDLPMMVGNNTSPLGTAFTVSIEAARGVTTGISAADRAHTIQVAIAEDAKAADLTRPGHVFPLVAQRGGVLVRTGQTEGSVDLARLAGLKPAGVICEIMNDDGTMARRPDLERFAERHGLTILSIADLIDYRMQRERLVHPVRELELPLGRLGTFRVHGFRDEAGGHVHLAFAMGTWTEDDEVLVRVQNRDLMVDLLGAARSDGGPSMFERALERVAREGQGVVVCLFTHPENAAEQIVERLAPPPEAAERAEAEDDDPEVRPDLREFGIGAQILAELGVRKLRLMTNTPMKIVGLEGFGLHMVERIPLLRSEDEEALTARAGDKKGG